MAVTGIGNNYNNVYEGAYAAQKNDAVRKQKIMRRRQRIQKTLLTVKRRIIIRICKRIMTVCQKGM